MADPHRPWPELIEVGRDRATALDPVDGRAARRRHLVRSTTCAVSGQAGVDVLKAADQVALPSYRLTSHLTT
jgi:hypothetical protein